MIAPLELYDAILLGGGGLWARHDDGTRTRLPLERWRAPVDAADESVLSRARGPVLDLGCGPGRHLHALAQRGVFALGIDISPAAVALARDRGGQAMQASVWGPLPAEGQWRTVLLLDGNIGIGGQPVALLERVTRLLASRGEALVEVDRPGVRSAPVGLRLQGELGSSRPFGWARVGVDGVAEIAAEAGLALTESWSHEGRWFARLQRSA